MAEKYIRKNKNSFNIVKNSRNYGKFQNIDDALFIRDELIACGWDLNSIEEIYEVGGNYMAVGVIDEKICILGKFGEKPTAQTIEKLFKRQLRNPNNSRYGLNITRLFDTYIIKKRIAGDDYIFGYYDKLEDAEFVRNFLLENQWNLSSFKQIEYDGENADFKVIEVIDDKAYVLESYTNKNDIDLDDCHREFLNQISKHKYGLTSHDYLNELADKIPELEERFNVKANDEVWSFDDVKDPLNDIIFNLTPFQKSVYDAVDNTTFDEIKKALIRYKSGNFDKKIQRNLDELVDLGLVCKNQNHYIKQSQ